MKLHHVRSEVIISMNQASTGGSKKQTELKLMRCLVWPTSGEYLEQILIWLRGYYQMKFNLFLVQWCQKPVSDFSKVKFVSTVYKKERSPGKQIDSQLLERFGESSIQIFQSMLHHCNIPTEATNCFPPV